MLNGKISAFAQSQMSRGEEIEWSGEQNKKRLSIMLWACTGFCAMFFYYFWLPYGAGWILAALAVSAIFGILIYRKQSSMRGVILTNKRALIVKSQNGDLVQTSCSYSDIRKAMFNPLLSALVLDARKRTSIMALEMQKLQLILSMTMFERNSVSSLALAVLRKL